jgi:hypothetical protein
MEDLIIPIIKGAEDEDGEDVMGTEMDEEEAAEDEEGIMILRVHPTTLVTTQSHMAILVKNGRLFLKLNEIKYTERGKGLKWRELLLQY